MYPIGRERAIDHASDYATVVFNCDIASVDIDAIKGATVVNIFFHLFILCEVVATFDEFTHNCSSVSKIESTQVLVPKWHVQVHAEFRGQIDVHGSNFRIV